MRGWFSHRCLIPKLCSVWGKLFEHHLPEYWKLTGKCLLVGIVAGVLFKVVVRDKCLIWCLLVCFEFCFWGTITYLWSPVRDRRDLVTVPRQSRIIHSCAQNGCGLCARKPGYGRMSRLTCEHLITTGVTNLLLTVGLLSNYILMLLWNAILYLWCTLAEGDP